MCCFWSLLEGSSEALWKTPGKDMTIQCRTETMDVQSLTVKSGIHESDLFFIHKANQESPTIRDIFQGRFQYHGNFPNMDILIKDLFLNDTGPYWCLYQKRNHIKRQMETLKGKGSVLLVVSGKVKVFL